MAKKGGRATITLDVLRKELATTKSEITVYMDSKFKEIHERFDEHEVYFTAIQDDLTGLRTDVNELKSDVSQLKTDVSGLKSDITQLKTDVSQLKFDVAQLKTDVSTTKIDIKEFRAETAGFHKGFSVASSRNDGFRFGLTGILEEKGILSAQQAGSLRAT